MMNVPRPQNVDRNISLTRDSTSSGDRPISSRTNYVVCWLDPDVFFDHTKAGIPPYLILDHMIDRDGNLYIKYIDSACPIPRHATIEQLNFTRNLADKLALEKIIVFAVLGQNPTLDKFQSLENNYKFLTDPNFSWSDLVSQNQNSSNNLLATSLIRILPKLLMMAI